MAYGIITPQFKSTDENMMFIIHTGVESRVCGPVTDIKYQRFLIVHDTTNIGKTYDNPKNTFYVKEDGRIKLYVAGPMYHKPYINAGNTAFLNVDEGLAFDSSIGYGLVVLEGNNQIRFTTRNRYIKIIDQVFFRVLGDDYGYLDCNLKFNYVKKIGVVLPPSIRGDTFDGYPSNFFFVFDVVGNSLVFRRGNAGAGPQTVLNSPFENYRNQSRIAPTSSMALIFDLTGL